NATPQLLGRARASAKLGELPTIVAACEWIANALFAESRLQILATGDVHKNAVIESLTAAWFLDGVPAVEHSADTAVQSSDLQLATSQRSRSLHQLHFPFANVLVNEVIDTVSTHLVHARH